MAIYFQVIGAPELQDLLNENAAATAVVRETWTIDDSDDMVNVTPPPPALDDSYGLQDEPRQPPASSGVIKGLTVEPHVSDEPCPICMEDCTENDTCSKLPCSHSFHRHCITKWLQMNHICPMCRYELPCGPKPSRCIAMRATQLQSHVDSLREYIHLRNTFANDEGDPTFGVDSLSEEELMTWIVRFTHF